MNLNNKNNLIYVMSLMPNYIFKVLSSHNNIVEFYDCKIIQLFNILNKHYNIQLKIFIDLVTLDYPKNKLRFQNIYNCLSIIYNYRLILKTFINKHHTIETITNIYGNSNWYEREAWDLFGIFYINHGDLRRILNDYNYKGYPLRKDFPLVGFVEVKYNFKKKTIIWKTVNPLLSKYRSYKINYNWKYV
jgi:NADH:ubiquinone oxidoreductase subunit C